MLTKSIKIYLRSLESPQLSNIFYVREIALSKRNLGLHQEFGGTSLSHLARPFSFQLYLLHVHMWNKAQPVRKMRSARATTSTVRK